MSLAVKELKELLRQQTWIDQLAEPLQDAVQGFYKAPAGWRCPGRLLNGTWLGHPLHPVITDVPIGSWIAAVVLDGMESSTGRRGFRPQRRYGRHHWRGQRRWCGCCRADRLAASERRIAPHRHAARPAQQPGAGSVHWARWSAARKRTAPWAAAWRWPGLTLAGAGAYLGGDLVFRQKIGVNHAPDELRNASSRPFSASTTCPKGRPTRAMLNDTPLVLVRRGQQVFALAESCAHLGGRWQKVS
jgi:hypothetical protein